MFTIYSLDIHYMFSICSLYVHYISTMLILFLISDVGYAQGMNDIMSRFLVVMGSESDAYWMFCNYMEHFKGDFMETGMLRKICEYGSNLLFITHEKEENSETGL